jgi:hypothetical protein
MLLMSMKVRLSLWTASTNGPIVHTPDDIWVWITTVTWYLLRETEELGEKHDPVLLSTPNVTHGPTQTQTRASAVKSPWLTAWTMARSAVTNMIRHLELWCSLSLKILYLVKYYKGKDTLIHTDLYPMSKHLLCYHENKVDLIAISLKLRNQFCYKNYNELLDKISKYWE